MKKRWIAIFMCACCITGNLPVKMSMSTAVQATVTASAAETTTVDSMKENLALMGILDSSMVNKAYNKKVTRKEFAKILVKASVYRETVNETTGGTSYADLSSKDEYAAYIKTAVDNQWMSGYLNGKFKPDKAITMKDATKAVLTMLGYSDSDFTGNKVNSRMAKFNMIGLNASINKDKNEKLTWKNVIYLLDNLLTAETKDGTVYAKKIGYTLNNSGEIDYNSVLKNGMNGPVLVEGDWKEQLPIGEDAMVYHNEILSTWENIKEYDVLYYSESKNIIWAYDNKVTGKVTNIAPNRLSPETITVAGNTYTLATSEVMNQFSFQGDYNVNQVVTLFLGLDNEVVAVKDTKEYNDVIYGAVLEVGTQSSDTSSTEMLEDYVVILDINGTKHTHIYDSDQYLVSKGSAIEISYSEEGLTTVKKASVPSMSFYGFTVQKDGSIGEYTIDPNAKILDYNNEQYETLSVGELEGVSLNSSNVLYYSCKEDKVIDELMLKGVSGVGTQYGIITGISGGSKQYSYTYTTANGTKTATFDEILEYVTVGSCYRVVEVLGNTYFTSLTQETVTGLSESYIQTDRYTFIPTDDLLVYYYSNGTYYPTTLSKITNASKCTVTAYYEGSTAMIKKVYFLVAKRG